MLNLTGVRDGDGFSPPPQTAQNMGTFRNVIDGELRASLDRAMTGLHSLYQRMKWRFQTNETRVWVKIFREEGMATGDRKQRTEIELISFILRTDWRMSPLF